MAAALQYPQSPAAQKTSDGTPKASHGLCPSAAFLPLPTGPVPDCWQLPRGGWVTSALWPVPSFPPSQGASGRPGCWGEVSALSSPAPIPRTLILPYLRTLVATFSCGQDRGTLNQPDTCPQDPHLSHWRISSQSSAIHQDVPPATPSVGATDLVQPLGTHDVAGDTEACGFHFILVNFNLNSHMWLEATALS